MTAAGGAEVIGGKGGPRRRRCARAVSPGRPGVPGDHHAAGADRAAAKAAPVMLDVNGRAAPLRRVAVAFEGVFVLILGSDR
jgi:hypothetical protein